MEEKKLKGFPLQVNIYAHSEEEVEECRKAIISFIGLHASQSRAVTAKKIANALSRWDSNPIVKNKIIQYFNN